MLSCLLTELFYTEKKRHLAPISTFLMYNISRISRPLELLSSPLFSPPHLSARVPLILTHPLTTHSHHYLYSDAASLLSSSPLPFLPPINPSRPLIHPLPNPYLPENQEISHLFLSLSFAPFLCLSPYSSVDRDRSIYPRIRAL